MLVSSPASVRAISTLSKHNIIRPWKLCRSLHMTGVKSAQPMKGIDIASVYSSRNTTELKSECDRRGLLSAGSHIEVNLACHDILFPND